MAHYIDKKTLVDEINRQHKILMQTDHTYGAQFVLGFRQACRQIIDFLDTFETKEVDFEKESELIANGIMISVQSNKYGTNIYNTKRNDFNHHHLQMAARKGIELGIKAVQKGE
jgi:hypothetical protein